MSFKVSSPRFCTSPIRSEVSFLILTLAACFQVEMSYPTTNAFIYSFTGFDETTRSHPCMNWCEKYTLSFDSREMFQKDYSEWHTDDYTYQKSNGQVTSGGAAAFDKVKEDYSFFSGTNHAPNFLCCWETADGWEMLGQAVMYANLAAPGGSGQVMTDPAGKKWDVGVPSAFHFFFVKDPSGSAGGIKMKRMEVYGDSMPVAAEMLKRGMMKPEQLMG